MNTSFLIAGTHSGCGKTTVTLGVMAALRQMGHVVQPFKCGPDFIDPTLHKVVCGRVSRNLDLRMCGRDFVRQVFSSHAREVNVVEGVMGLFDGGEASAASLSKVLGLPILLVVDVRSAAESVAAVVKGFEELDPDINLASVLLNRVGSERHLELVRTAVEKHCRTPLIGYLPRDVEFTIPDRHLGLRMGGEGVLDEKRIQSLGETIRQHVDCDLLLSLKAAGTDVPESVPSASLSSPVRRLGVARDEAFCFYYEDNLDLFRRAGAEIVFFSPLHDTILPPDLDLIYLGGGYPELHVSGLSQNREMLGAIRNWSEAGNPLYGECGGLMYLTRAIVDAAGKEYEMAGIFPVRSHMRPRLSSLGYREAEIIKSCLWGKKGEVLRGHEFHYSDIDEMPADVSRVYRLNNGRLEGYRIRKTLGSYLHLHFGGTPRAIDSFVRGVG
ncbi:MAG: cobyrinate a,c-diamide synthase [Thermodesulfobacteriota bacterium]|nr:cobyrinate a,c-diamide synthase [Thermodesulfobacteriota bacterium]